MKKIVVSIQNGLLAEAVISMLKQSGEFEPYRVSPFGKTGDTVGDCETYAADIALMEVSYGGGTTVEKRQKEVRELRRRVPKCKIVLLCDENSAPDIAREVMLAKRDGLIDNFFYSSVTAKYLLAALSSI